MSQILPANSLIVVGQRVYTGLYGRGFGTVVAIHGQQRPESVRGVVVAMGGSAYFDIVFDGGERSSRLPEAILRGIQWTVFADVAPAGVVLQVKFKAEQYEEEKAAEAAAEQARFSTDVAMLRVATEFAHLEPLVDGESGSRQAIKNIRRDLKKHFPKTKFSVRSDYSSARIRWTDGPTDDQVSAIVDRYKAGRFNGMSDSYDFEASAFGDVFGDIQYIFTTRERSPELIGHAIEQAFTRYGVDLQDIEKPTAEDFSRGRLWNVRICTEMQGADNLQAMVNRLAWTTAVVDGQMVEVAE